MNKLLDIYYNLIPYDYRPSQLWYVLKCWAWHRYTTIKPRYLSHKWTDKVDVLPHIMFEVLSEFIEDECSPGWVEWYGDYPHVIKVDGVDRNVRDEMQALYSWWHEKYNGSYPEIIDEIYDSLPLEDFCFPIAKQAEKVYGLVNRIEQRMDEELEEKMIRLVRLRPYMWT